MSTWVRTSALHACGEGHHEVSLEGPDLRICELPFSGKLLLQSRADIDLIQQRVSSIIGQNLPVRPNSCAMELITGKLNPEEFNPEELITGSGNSILWLSPNQWLIILDQDKLAETRRQLATALSATPHLLSEVSDARSGFEVSGKQARKLLAKICALDLDSHSFAAGRCAQSLLIRVPLLLQQVDETPTFHLYVDRSVSRYAWDWLSDAAVEFLTDNSAT